MSTDDGTSTPTPPAPTVPDAPPVPESPEGSADPFDQAVSSSHSPLAPGTRVEVRSSFDQRWTSGFEVVEASDTSYRLRRLSDGSDLPGSFTREDIRRERNRSGHWWY